jgi:hypothetical protein
MPVRIKQRPVADTTPVGSQCQTTMVSPKTPAKHASASRDEALRSTMQVRSAKNFPSLHDKNKEELFLQPETRPISQEQLIAEAKSIYAGLVMVESRCIEVDDKYAAQTPETGAQPQLKNEQWQALIALHRTLLHEHHDFFLASRHPSVSPALKKLASKYAMPARMWKQGIHSFLEILRHRLPGSRDHMLEFIYLAYSMMALLYETVPAFEETWIECLGDLARYRMAIDDTRDREMWTGLARNWYSKASDESPTTGRLYHHIATSSRPNQFFGSSLDSVPVQDFLLTRFDPAFTASERAHHRSMPEDIALIRWHTMPPAYNVSNIVSTFGNFEKLLDIHIECVARFQAQMCEIAMFSNTQTTKPSGTTRKRDFQFPPPVKENLRPFPEDFAVRGLLWTQDYFPEDYFQKLPIDDEEVDAEVASMANQRKEGICRLTNYLHIRISWMAMHQWVTGKTHTTSSPFLRIRHNWPQSRWTRLFQAAVSHQTNFLTSPKHSYVKTASCIRYGKIHESHHLKRSIPPLLTST